MLAAIRPQLEEFSACFDLPMSQLTEGRFYRLTPNAQNPYKRLYVQN